MTMSKPATVRSRGRRVRLAGLVAAAFVLITSPNVFAANATNVDIRLPAGYSIAGTIRDSTGAVLPHASVSAIGTSSHGSAETGATGNYTIVGLKAGSYQIHVTAPFDYPLVDGYYTSANANHFTASSAASTKVTVGPSKTGIDVKLPAGLHDHRHGHDDRRRSAGLVGRRVRSVRGDGDRGEWIPGCHRQVRPRWPRGRLVQAVHLRLSASRAT